MINETILYDYDDVDFEVNDNVAEMKRKLLVLLFDKFKFGTGSYPNGVKITINGIEINTDEISI